MRRVGTVPILRRLRWAQASLPSARKSARLRPLPEPKPLEDRPSVSVRVARRRKQDEDWQDVGFIRVGKIQSPPEDSGFAARTHTTWRTLGTSLDHGRPT